MHVVTYGNDELAITRSEQLIRNQIRMGVSPAARLTAADEGVLGYVDEGRRRRVPQ